MIKDKLREHFETTKKVMDKVASWVDEYSGYLNIWPEPVVFIGTVVGKVDHISLIWEKPDAALSIEFSNDDAIIVNCYPDISDLSQDEVFHFDLERFSKAMNKLYGGSNA